MSVCYDIVCDDCEEALWIGQGSIIYSGELKTMESLKLFLYEHLGHKLRFISSESHEYKKEWK